MNDPFTFINYVFDLHHDLIASNKMSYSNGSIYIVWVEPIYTGEKQMLLYLCKHICMYVCMKSGSDA